jgi:AraC-like DNA-binding protein
MAWSPRAARAATLTSCAHWPVPPLPAPPTHGSAGWSTTFRRYQRWARLLHAVRGMVAGHELTRCAADAGFASPSHFSDTFHRTFGLSPSALLNPRVQIDLDA